MNYINLYF